MSSTPPPSEPEEQLNLLLPGLPSSDPLPPKGKRKKAKPAPLVTIEDVLANPSLTTERLDMREALTVSIQRKGGSRQVYVQVTSDIYHFGFGYRTAKLFYAAYNVSSNNRKDLPPVVLRVLILYEFAVMRRLDSHTMESEAQTDVDEEIISESKLAIQATKRFLYWLDYGKNLPGS